jgi:S-DNA-T family DNA segregation ATPase FtsK/SpoIIIE
MDACNECGFVYAEVGRAEIPGRLVSFGPRYRSRLVQADPATPDGLVTLRPSPEVWSPLEYACHLRDVLGVQHERLVMALTEDRPVFVPMGRDERVVEQRYNQQDPVAVAAEIEVRAEVLASAFAELVPEQWERLGVYNWPERAERTMGWLGRHTVHEGEHHLLDMDRSSP